MHCRKVGIELKHHGMRHGAMVEEEDWKRHLKLRRDVGLLECERICELRTQII